MLRSDKEPDADQGKCRKTLSLPGYQTLDINQTVAVQRHWAKEK